MTEARWRPPRSAPHVRSWHSSSLSFRAEPRSFSLETLQVFPPLAWPHPHPLSELVTKSFARGARNVCHCPGPLLPSRPPESFDHASLKSTDNRLYTLSLRGCENFLQGKVRSRPVASHHGDKSTSRAVLVGSRPRFKQCTQTRHPDRTGPGGREADDAGDAEQVARPRAEGPAYRLRMRHLRGQGRGASRAAARRGGLDCVPVCAPEPAVALGAPSCVTTTRVLSRD